MSKFTVHTHESAPEKSRDTLSRVKARYSFVPNVYGVMAEAPAAVTAYEAISNAFSASSLSPVEQQVVLLAISIANGCTYCAAAHSMVATMVEMPAEVLAALRDGKPLPDGKLEALRALTIAAVEKRGWLTDDDLGGFYGAGYTKANLLEVFTGISLKVLSNYSNHVSETPLDDAFAGHKWQPPGE